MEPFVARADDLVEFGSESFAAKPLFETERVKVVLVGLSDGQTIPLHEPDVDLTIAVLRGTGEIWAGEAARSVAAGDLAVVPAGATRGVRARGGPLVLLHVVSPPPSAEDHAVDRRPWAIEGTGPDVRGALHAEHEELLPHLDHVRALANEADELDEASLRGRLEPVLAFLEDTLLAHADAEERALYPVVDRLLRATGGATRTMSIDHRAIGDLVAYLRARSSSLDDPRARAEVGDTLRRLEAIVRLHFGKEEEVYLPLLDRLGEGEARALLDALDQASAGHSHAHTH